MKRKGNLGGIFAMALILVLTLVLSVGSVSAEEPTIVDSGNCGKDGSNVTWTLDSAGLLTISGTGAMADYESKTDSASGEEITTAPWGNQAKMVKTVVIEDGVTGIGNYAFYCCTDLTGVNMGSTVTSIGTDAFAACIGLTSVTIPDSVTDIEGEAFAQCMGLTSVVIPDSVKSIGIGAFHYCTSLTSVIVGNGVTEIGQLAFWKCTALTDVTLGSSVTAIGEQAFSSCEKLTGIVIPDSVTSIGEYAFADCESLAKVTIGTGVTDFGWETFSGCTKLAEINYNAKAAADLKARYDTGLTAHYPDVFKDAGTSVGGVRVKIGDGVERIPAYIFKDCTGLTGSVTIPNSVTDIGWYAFADCTGLTGVTLGGNVTKIEERAFNNCTGLTSIVFPDSVTDIGNWAFAGCTGLTNVKVPGRVTSISEGVFANCTGLTDAVIPDGVTSVGERAFSGCVGLTGVEIPDDVTSIGDYAFSGCAGLTGIEIPEGVTKIGLGAFSFCENLAEVRYNAKAAGDIQYDPMTDIAEQDHVFRRAGADRDGLTVTIGSGVECIPSRLFYGCTGLKEVHFIGTEEEWKAVSIGSDNDPLINAAITYVKEPISGSCGDNLTYKLDSAGLLTISGTGAMADYESKTDSASGEEITTAPWGNQAKTVVIGDGVTGIGAAAFYGCSGLTGVTMGSNVTSIGESAFRGCTGLTGIVLPGSVTSIGEYAFSNCDSLTAIEIPEGVTTLGNSAFFGCDNLKEIRYNARAAADLTGLSGAFRSAGASVGGVKVIFGESVEKIPGNLFSNCESLTSVTIGSNVTSIGDNAFLGCKGLVEINYNARAAECAEDSFDSGDGLKVTFGDSVERIPDYIFQDCPGLTSVTIGSSATTIGHYAFNRCMGLTSIKIPESMTNIGYMAFSGCTSLADVYYGGTERQWNAITIDDGNDRLLQANRHCEGKETLVPPTAKPSYVGASGKPYIYWSAVDGANRYYVYRSGSKDGTYTFLGTTTAANYTDSKANAGYTYYYKVKALAADGTDSSFSAAVAITCRCARPVVKTDYWASTGKPYIKWTAVAGASQYEVYRSGSKDGAYTLLGTTTATNYTDNKANAGYTYYYKVKAISKVKSAANSSLSAAVAITCRCARPVVTPDYLTSTGKPYIKWTAVAGVGQYEVYRSGSKDGTYTLLGTTTATNYTDNKANAGYTYYYKVKAISKVKSVANSSLSAAVAITCRCARPVVKTDYWASTGKPYIKWDAVDGAGKYYIYRSGTKNGTYTLLGTTTATNYTDSKANAGYTYYYKVQAISSALTMAKVYLSPSNQTDNCYAYGNTNEAVQCGKIADSCRIALERSGVTVQVGHMPSMQDKCKESNAFGADLHVPIHTNAFNGTVTGTRMFCLNSSGEGMKACEAIFAWLAPITPGTSENIQVDASLYEVRVPSAPAAYVECEFHDNATAAKWIVEHTVDIGEAIARGICDYFGVTFKEKEQPESVASTDKLYRVQEDAFANRPIAEEKNTANSSLSAAVAVTCRCARPVVKTDYWASTGKPYIKWTAVAGASQYEVYRSGSKDGTYTLLGTTTAANYTDSKANAGYTYYYKVKAISKVKSTADSSLSAAVAITCRCARPSVKITTSNGSPKLTWNAVTGANKYYIYRSTEANGTFEYLYSTKNLFYTNKSAVAGTTYYYKVKAVSKVKSTANSAFSTVVSIRAR